ncbi:MAG TPA: Ku protein [Solirubrobacteraceae bacterium]|jgi:DNA end-binding protein Ku|nr:Ku protein [Solirubrobacteraceae bacterium]
MPRAIWSGAISFGLVNVPVKLYSAVSRKSVRFHQLNGETQSRIQQKRVDATTGEEVPYESIVKGYEISPDRYVVIEPGELEALDPEKTRSIDILDFVDEDEIDPIFYDHPYYLVPGTGAEKAYRLLLEAMEQAGKVAVAKVVIRSKESLVAIRPAGDVLTMSTMLFHDEVVPVDRLDELPEADKATKATKRELDMAEQLIGSLTSDFDPERYRDEYRERVLDLIERKAEGEEISVAAPAAEEAEPVPDLMAALEASIKAAKGEEEEDGKGARKPARKRAAAKSSSNGSGGAKKKPATRSKAKAGSSKSGSSKASSKK